MKIKKMNSIVKIGYNYFLVRKNLDASKLISILSGSVQCDEGYYAGKYVYFPNPEPREISMKVLPPNHFFPFDPSKHFAAKGPKLLTQ